MNEKLQKMLDKIDFFTEKLSFLPKAIDSLSDLLKKPVISCIPEVVSKIASKFGAIAITIYALIYAAFCLKNMIICFFFENAPAGISFGGFILAIIAIVFSNYIIYKTDGMFNDIIKSSACRISSLNIFAILTVFFLFASVVSVILGVYTAIECEYFPAILYGLAISVFFVLLALFCSTPEEFAVSEDKNASAGEDFVALMTFSIKTVLRLVPIFIFILAIVGICQCVPEICETYTESYGNTIVIHSDSLLYDMNILGLFLLVGIIPLFAYLYYIASYVTLDIVRAILSLPRALNELKK